MDTTNAELVAVDGQQKLLKVQDRTIYLAWNKYMSCWEAEVFHQVQDQYGRFTSEFLTGVTGNSEKQVIEEALKVKI
jgi:hypothetical protein